MEGCRRRRSLSTSTTQTGRVVFLSTREEFCKTCTLSCSHEQAKKRREERITNWWKVEAGNWKRNPQVDRSSREVRIENKSSFPRSSRLFEYNEHWNSTTVEPKHCLCFKVTIVEPVSGGGLFRHRQYYSDEFLWVMMLKVSTTFDDSE